MPRRYTTGDLAFAAMFTALTSVSAWFAVPFFGPVPFTMQVLCVLLAGLVLGSRLAGMSMVAYVVLGLVAPVYAGGASGIGTLLGPAGGYIWGFILGATLVGRFADRLEQPRLLSLVAVAAAGLVPIYALGATWLAGSLHSFNARMIVWGGVVQFLPMDLMKAALAALVARALAGVQVRLPARTISDRSSRRTVA